MSDTTRPTDRPGTDLVPVSLTATDIRHHRLELPAFRGLKLHAAEVRDSDSDAVQLYFPVAGVCDALGVDDKTQRKRLMDPETDFPGWLAYIPIPTVKGTREALCIEFAGLGPWLAEVQTRRVAPEHQAKLQTFKREVFTAAGEILLGRHKPLPVVRTPRQTPLDGLRDLALLTEGRVEDVESRMARLEQVVSLAEGEGERLCRCPNCGHLLRILANVVAVVSADTPED